ncbi:hypothetical protein [Saccharothrix texasensis]|uniref:Uncharacterized protein n=1 Tax=Saccharothrix texasensis TaxID=103734 RepID=A0A3N1HGH1_9PSEU|nr:hypothetical protein [Saccharothrix texasensis]ROP41586.1 hypothetical protein EDD40_7022 [Saccharothrix texasensis]
MAERIIRPTATAPTTNGPDPPVRSPIADRVRAGPKAGLGGIGLPVDRPVLVLVGGGMAWRRRVRCRTRWRRCSTRAATGEWSR